MKKLFNLILAIAIISAMTLSIAALTGEWGVIGGGSSNNGSSGNSGSSGSSGSSSDGGYYQNPSYPSWIYSYNGNSDDDVFINEDDDDDVYANEDDVDSGDEILVEDPIEALILDWE